MFMLEPCITAASSKTVKPQLPQPSCNNAKTCVSLVGWKALLACCWVLRHHGPELGCAVSVTVAAPETAEADAAVEQ